MQHDFEILNADANTGLAMRAAINAALQALATQSSGATAPDSPYPYQVWVDTANGLIKQRNAGNDAWLIKGRIEDDYSGVLDGWVPANETWVYDSGSNTFSVSGDKTGKYNIGDKIKLTQSAAVAYFYIINVEYSSPNTLVTLSGGSDYYLSGAEISDNYFSKASSPQGFPQWFNYAVTWDADTTSPAIVNGTLQGKFRVVGRSVLCVIFMAPGSSTTFGTGNWWFMGPITSSKVKRSTGAVKMNDAGNALYIGVAYISGAMPSIRLISDSQAGWVSSLVPFTWANGDDLQFSIEYEL